MDKTSLEGLEAAEEILKAHLQAPVSPASPASPQDKKEGMLEVFESLDINQDGVLDVEELTEVLALLHPTLWDSKRVGRLIEAMDIKKEKKVSFIQFKHWIMTSEGTFQKYRFLDAVRQLSPKHETAIQEVEAKLKPY